MCLSFTISRLTVGKQKRTLLKPFLISTWLTVVNRHIFLTTTFLTKKIFHKQEYLSAVISELDHEIRRPSIEPSSFQFPSRQASRSIINTMGPGVLPYLGYIGMCGPKEYGVLAVLV